MERQKGRRRENITATRSLFLTKGKKKKFRAKSEKKDLIAQLNSERNGEKT